MQGKVITLFASPNKGLPMEELGHVQAIAGRGLAGDRYASGKGAWSKARLTTRQVSLISIEAIEDANVGLVKPFTPAETRRNIIVSGVNLNSLVVKEFTVGEVRMRGIELCDPCERPSVLARKPNFAVVFNGKGGLRAEILNNGIIRAGDAIAA